MVLAQINRSDANINAHSSFESSSSSAIKSIYVPVIGRITCNFNRNDGKQSFFLKFGNFFLLSNDLCVALISLSVQRYVVGAWLANAGFTSYNERIRRKIGGRGTH